MTRVREEDRSPPRRDAECEVARRRAEADLLRADFDMDELGRLMPVQNGSAASRIANVCRRVLGMAPR